MTFDTFRDILLKVDCPHIHQFTAPPDTPPPYIVWAESMESTSLCGDGRKLCQVSQGTIDLYSKTPDDNLINDIQNTLSTHGIPFYLNDVLYESDTKLIHHEWIFEVVKWEPEEVEEE